MDSAKARNVGKLAKIGGQNATNKENDLTEDEKQTITDLKKLYENTIKLDVDLQRDIYNMEKQYESKHNEIFDRRCKIIEAFRQKIPEDPKRLNSNVANFWLTVLKASYTEFISKRDEQILSHLIDIRSKLYNEPVVKFALEFTFELNNFFHNRVLTKTYYLNCLPDAENPLNYDGAEIYKCEGCVINWKDNFKERARKNQFIFSSFFDFFDPPKLPENTEDPTYADVNAILQNDFELGFYLKERVIPKAILFFTGEISDCQSSNTESETEDDLDEDDEDDDEEDDNERNEDDHDCESPAENDPSAFKYIINN